MKPDDAITVHALHADGQWYRRWPTTVESINDACIVTYSPANCPLEDAVRGSRTLPRAIRAYYWFDRFYNLVEEFAADGSLDEIYINIAGAPQMVEGGFSFIDHELDVSKQIGQPAVILDEDEFEAAIKQYGYQPEFIARCRAAVEAARELAERWLLDSQRSECSNR
jgi:protein associated with RNAse G/E